MPAALTFCNKICWETAILKEVFVLHGIVQLAIRHAPTLEPAVKNLLHPPQFSFALVARDGEVVDLVSV